jgi:hypothetical protein
MGNSYNDTTSLWVIDETGALETSPREVMEVVYFPSAAGDDLILTDSADNLAIALKAGVADATPVHICFAPQGRRLPSLKVGTIDGGTAHIYLKIV